MVYLEQLVKPVDSVSVAAQGAGEQHDEVLDLEHEASVCTVRRMGPQGNHNLNHSAVIRT